MYSIYLWIGFILFIVFMLALDLGVFNKKVHIISIKEAFIWSIIWVVLSLLFAAGIFIFSGEQKAFEFLTGYVIEKALSVDNIFVFILIFSYFKVPAEYQHKVLFWGVFGALVLRAIFIFAGVALIDQFHWIIYIFGAFLIFTGIKMITDKDKKFEPETNIVLKIARKVLKISPEYSGSKFFVKNGAELLATPLFLVLLFIETTDVIFAVDSIPAILAISNDTFIIFTSNVFAILGLRALYFALSGIIDKLKYLSYGLSVVLVFVGVKMLISGFIKIPILVSLGFIILVIAISILASYIPAIDKKNPA